MPYDELVKRLRNLSGTDNISEFDGAAEAIEELSAVVESYHHRMAYVPQPPKEESNGV